MTKVTGSSKNKTPKGRIVFRSLPNVVKTAQIKENDHCFVDEPEEMFIDQNICADLFNKEVLVVSVNEDDSQVRILNTEEIFNIPTYCLQKKTKTNFKPKNR